LTINYSCAEETKPSSRQKQSKELRFDANGKTYVHLATEMEVESVTQALDAFKLGEERKRVAATAINEHSSRSHTLFSVLC
jgi:biopolymer transport protein ExbD